MALCLILAEAADAISAEEELRDIANESEISHMSVKRIIERSSG